MNRSNKIRALIGLAVVIAVVVGISPKEAKAVQFEVFCWWLNGQVQVPVTEDDIVIHFYIDTDDDGFLTDEVAQDPTDQGNGFFFYDLPGDYVLWGVSYTDIPGIPEFVAVDPWANPGQIVSCSSSSFEWQFAFPM